MSEVDGCFHLATITSLARSIEDWVETHRTNLTGTITILNAARSRAGRPAVPVVYASSAAIYGDDAPTPIGEATPPAPVTPYAADKLGCELHAAIGWQQFAIPTVGLRLFNVFGPRQDASSPYSGVISIFADRLRRGLPIGIHGDGLQVRDFVYVGDAIAHLVAAMARNQAGSQIFNVCTGKGTSIRELARLAADTLGTKLAIEHGPARPRDIRRSIGSNAAAAAALGVRAETPLEVGLKLLLGPAIRSR